MLIEKFFIAGRKVRLVTRTKTQTINVCTRENTLGKYEARLCITDPARFVTEEMMKKMAFLSTEAML